MNPFTFSFTIHVRGTLRFLVYFYRLHLVSENVIFLTFPFSIICHLCSPMSFDVGIYDFEKDALRHIIYDIITYYDFVHLNLNSFIAKIYDDDALE